MTEEMKETITEETVAKETNVEETLTMKDFERELEQSFKTIRTGDIVHGTVIGISDTEVTLDLNYYTEGIIPLEELSNDPRFSIKADVTLGEKLSAVVIRENKEGVLVLSKKQADNVLAWDKLTELKDNQTPVSVKIADSTNGGVITYLHGIRAFIPASKLALTFVEDTAAFVGKTMQAVVITVNESEEKLVLSVKDILKEQETQARNSRIARLPVGTVVSGTVEKLAPYGAFVNIGDDLSGLVHISQICAKRIKSPSEVLKEGDTVTVKITDVKDGKISLSMTAVEEDAQADESVEEVEAETFVYEDKTANTTMASLFANIKL